MAKSIRRSSRKKKSVGRSTRKSPKRTLRKSVKKSPRKSPKRTLRKSVKKSPKRAIRKSVKKSVRKSPKRVTKMSPKRVAKMSPKRVAKMSPKRVAKMSPKRVAKIQPQSSTYMEDKIINTEKIKEIAKKSMNDIGGYLKTTGEKVKDVTGNVVEKVKDITGNVVEKVKDVTGNFAEKLYEIDSEDEKTPTKETKQSEPEDPVKAEEPFKEKWELYTMDDCIFCKNAKDVLEGRVAEDPENKSLKIEKGYENTDPVVIAWLAKYGDGWPKIFLNGKFIGGYSNLEATFKEINNGSI